MRHRYRDVGVRSAVLHLPPLGGKGAGVAGFEAWESGCSAGLLAAMLERAAPLPPSKSPVKCGGVGKAEHVGNLARAEIVSNEVLEGKFVSGLSDDTRDACSFFLKSSS